MDCESNGNVASLRLALAEMRSARQRLLALGGEAKAASDRAFNDGVEDESAPVHQQAYDYDALLEKLDQVLGGVACLIADEKIRANPSLNFVDFE